jgi:hypothetical protein
MKLFTPLDIEIADIQHELGEHLASIREEKKHAQRLHDFAIIDLNRLKNFYSLQKFIHDNKLTLRFCMGFWCEPGTRGYIHRDLDSWAINIPLRGIGGRQIWVNVDTPPVLTDYGNTNTTKFEIYPDDTPRTEIDSLVLTTANAVNTNILHYVDNADNSEVRMIITMRFFEDIGLVTT